MRQIESTLTNISFGITHHSSCMVINFIMLPRITYHILSTVRRKYKNSTKVEGRKCSDNSAFVQNTKLKIQDATQLNTKHDKAWGTSAYRTTHSHHFTTSLKDNKGQKTASGTMKEIYCDKIWDFIQEQNS